MKRYIIWLGRLAGGLILLLGILVFSAWLYRDELAGKIREEINSNMEADLEFGTYSVNIFRHFPDVTLTVNDLIITGRGAFSADTLSRIGQLGIEVDLYSLFREPLVIESVHFDKGNLFAKVLSDGRANWDIFPATDAPAVDTSDAGIAYRIQRISFRDAFISYDDLESNIQSDLHQVQIDLEKNAGDKYWQSLITVPEWNAKMEGMQLLQKARAEWKAALEFSQDSFGVAFGENALALNEIEFALDGYAQMPDTTIEMDIRFKSSNASFHKLLSLVPYIYSTDFDQIKATGTCSVNGQVKGQYDGLHFPDSDLELNVDQGSFRYPDLPGSAENISMQLKVTNQQGEWDQTVIDLTHFRASVSGQPISARFYLERPESHPTLEASLQGKLDLRHWKELLPLENTKRLEGTVDADLFLKGSLVAIQQKALENLDARGRLEGNSIRYEGDLLKHPIGIDHFLLQLRPQFIAIDDLNGTAGKSDVALSGKVYNYLNYLWRDEKLRVEMEIQSQTLDANEWVDSGSASAGSQSQDSMVRPMAIEIPKNLDVSLGLNIGHFNYQNYDLENLKGILRMLDGTVKLDPFSFDMLGGKIGLVAQYGPSQSNAGEPELKARLNLLDLGFAPTFEAFNTVQRLAPIGKRSSGIFSADLQLDGRLMEGFTPDLGSLNALLHFRTDKLMISQSAFFQQIGEMVGSRLFDSPTLSKVDARIKVLNGRVEIEPFDTRMGETKLRMGGSQGLDGLLNYQLMFDVPSRAFEKEAKPVAEKLFAAAGEIGVNLKWPERVHFDVDVSGSLKKPKLKLNVADQLKGTRDQLIEQVKDKVSDELNKARQEAIRKAEKQAAEWLAAAEVQGDQLIREARKKAEQLQAAADQNIEKLRKEADRQADELIRKAGENPIKKIAAEETAKRIKKEAQDEADKLKKEAAGQAEKLVDEANKQKTQLLEKARQEGEALIRKAESQPIG